MEFNENRINKILFLYYSRQDIEKAIFDFSGDRECIASYMMKYFGKRPDFFQYKSDILGQVKQGATSFHCSEELWYEPSEVSTDLSRKELNNLRKGWDLLLDIDSPYLEYSKIYARLIVNLLKFHGIENIGVKFSVSGDTPILIQNKDQISLLPISKAILLFKKGKNIKILSLDKDKKLKFSKVYDSLEHKDTLYEIKHSQSTIPLKATGYHSVFIWDKGDAIQKKVTELKKGDFLISYNSLKNPFESYKLQIMNKFEFAKNQHSKKIITKKIKVTKELMRLIGYFLAEGHVTNIINQTGFSFNRNEIEYIEDVKNLLSTITQRKISIRHPNPNSTQILIHSKEWANFFDTYCGKKKNKHVPPFTFKAAKELFLELLRGYIRGDGYKTGKYGIVVKSVSKKLITEMVWLCKLNNISCTLFWEKSKSHPSPQGNMFKESLVYILRIPKSELENLEFNIKRNKFSPFAGDKVFPVDGLREVYKQIKPKMFNDHRPEQMTLKKKRANLNRIKKVLKWFNDFKSIEPNSDSKKILSNYEDLFNSDISVIEIKEIIKKEKEIVYDVSVEETEAFFGNYYPVLLHNSGNKGFHIIVPWGAFPKEVYGMQTKDMFPEWPKLICQYLTETLREKLADEIFENENLSEIAKKIGKKKEDLIITECLSCHRPVKLKDLVTWSCFYCKTDRTMLQKNKRIPKCPDCKRELIEKFREKIYVCDFCDINSKSNPDMFSKTRAKTESLIEADLVLVSSRHLFRMPYSLHEKTALSSIVIDKDKIKDFQIKDANPFKAEIKNFYPKPKINEAKELLLQVLDWKEHQEKEQDFLKEQGAAISKLKGSSSPKKANPKKANSKYQKILIDNPSDEIFPPCIKNILKGIKDDGRKRALFILINFFKSLGLNEVELEKRINLWNDKNYQPLKKGYIQSQLNWYRKNTTILPPNCDKSNYQDLNICHPDQLCRQIKNPLNYSVKRFFKSINKFK